MKSANFAHVDTPAPIDAHCSSAFAGIGIKCAHMSKAVTARIACPPTLRSQRYVRLLGCA